MCAVVLGLVGAVLAVGAAGAAGCDRTFTLVSFENPSFTPQKDLVGAVVAEIRHTAGPKDTAIEVIGKPGRFVVRYEFSSHATPGTMGFSSVASRAPKMVWNGKDPGRDVTDAEVYGGPLSGLRLEQNPCE